MPPGLGRVSMLRGGAYSGRFGGLARALVAGFLLATLVASVGHNHLRPSESCSSAACIHCGGGGLTRPIALPDPPPQVGEFAAVAPIPVPPTLRSLLRLDQSGCAPPAGFGIAAHG